MNIIIYNLILLTIISCSQNINIIEPITIELLTDVETIEKVSPCLGDYPIEKLVVLKVTNNDCSSIVVSLSRSMPGYWYSPESILYFDEKINVDTLYGGPNLIVSSYGSRVDTLSKNEVGYYCIDRDKFIYKKSTYEIATFIFYHEEEKKSFRLFTISNNQTGEVEQIKFPLPEKLDKGAVLKISEDRSVILN